MKKAKKFLSVLLVCCMIWTGGISSKAFAAEIGAEGFGNVSVGDAENTGTEEQTGFNIPEREELDGPGELDEVPPENPAALSGNDTVSTSSAGEEMHKKQPEFYYEQKFGGVKVMLSADAGVIPAGANVSVQRSKRLRSFC